MKTNSKIQEKRNELKSLSKLAKILVKEGAADSVNSALKMMYFIDGHEELNTLQQWNKLGYSVKKGEKALLLWGSPMDKGKKGDEAHEMKAETSDEIDDDLNFFPICFVFSNKQVIINTRKGGEK